MNIENRNGLLRSRGFSLLELLFVIAIVAILIGMFLPPVRRVRTASRRTQCMNNLRQLALASLNYESAHGYFPPCVGAESVKGVDSENLSGFVAIQPFLVAGEIPPFHRDENRPVLWTKGYEPWEVREHCMRCPAVKDDEVGFAPTHYAFCIGDRARNVADPEVNRGIFAGRLKTSFGDVPDGTSNTIMFGEIGPPRGGLARFAINQPEGFLDDPTKVLELASRDVRLREAILKSKVARGGLWAEGRSGPAQFNTILPPNSPSAVVGGTIGGDGFFAASGPHPGTLTVALGDGSSHAISVEIDCGDLSAATATEEQMVGGAGSHYGAWGALGSANDGADVDVTQF